MGTGDMNKADPCLTVPEAAWGWHVCMVVHVSVMAGAWLRVVTG